MSDQSFIIEDVIIFTGDHFIETGYLSVNNGRIAEIGAGDYPKRTTTLPRISRPGHTLIPGLIDSHIHGLFGNERSIEQSLRFGVCTVMDMHNEPHHIKKLQELSKSDKTRYANFKCAGVSATIKGGWPEAVVLSHGATPQAQATVNSWPKLQDASQAEAYVKHQIEDCGAEYIKLMHEVGDTIGKQLPRPTISLQSALVQSAHEHALIAVGHAFSHQGATDLLEAGVDGLTHIFLDRPPSENWIELCKKNKAHCNPTLTTCGSQTAENQDLQEKFAADPLAQSMLFDTTPREALHMADRSKSSLENAYSNTKALYQAGIPLIVGSDSSGQARGTQYGLGVHMEMWQFVHKIGMSPEETLKAATSTIADRFGFEDCGRLVVGRPADMVLIRGDAREVLADERSLCLPMCGVWREGELAGVYRNSMQEVGKQKSSRKDVLGHTE